MKLGGFALKKGKKKALGASAGFSPATPSASTAPEKVFVTDFDPDAPAPLTDDGQKPLVIPLLETNTWSEDLNKKPNQGTSDVDTGTSADEQAAAEILAETQAVKSQSDDPRQRDLVIPISDKREQKRAELFQDDDKRPKSDQKKPILQQNVVPGLDELQDVTDKYRHDVALRPEAPDVHSDVYESVPVEAFGAALLRGMGWKGDVDPDDMGVAPQPRHKLLGLGATKRPKMPGEDKKKRKKRKDDKDDKNQDRRSGLNMDKPRREDKESHSSRRNRSPDRDSRRRSRSRSERRKRSRSRSRSQDRRRERDREQDRRGRGRHRDRDRDRRSRSRSRSSRHSRRR
ncbi:G-patch domain and KOW motifs-containing protein [Phytophthora citrophthora]|uniref:G-patch domain and KOW motifs-containing protein n=1 Tax=Phytophthora citrophthora TaxID=4793 RepID=A0AAD9G5M3_9STRA|nr:G-patch domain and KOW motifs-containing protein [Phytophthora citrophthora]